MSVDERTAHTRVELSAVLTTISMPAGVLAQLAPGDCIETESEPGLQHMVRLRVGATTVALASVEEIGGRLVARIIHIGEEPEKKRFEQWQFRKNIATPH